jgi:acyl carrier protein
MEHNEIRMKLLEIIHRIRPDVNPKNDCSLFSLAINLSDLDMVYILLDIRDELGIVIDDTFIESIHDTTLDNLVNAVVDVM